MNDVVQKTIFFGVIDWKLHNKNVDVLKIFKGIEALPFGDDLRYYSASDGQRYAVMPKIETINGADEIFGCIGDSRTTNLPFLENKGKISPLKIANGAGIFDAMHFLIKKNKKGKWIIVYEFNIYAPRILALNIYVQNKLNTMVDFLAIHPVSGESINEILKKFKQVRKMRLGIYYDANVEILSPVLSDALRQLQQEQNGNFVEIVFSMRYSKKRTLSGNILNNIPRFFKDGNPELNMAHFYLSGTSMSGEKREENLMKILLKEQKQVQKMYQDHRSIDSEKMYQALEEAFMANSKLLDSL